MIDITATIDHAIKEVWLNDIASDYEDFALLKEDSLKCALYHHLRVQLEDILSEHNLRIYPEYYIPELKYKSDIAIVKIDPYDIKPKLKDMALNIEAIIEIIIMKWSIPSLVCSIFWGLLKNSPKKGKE